MLRLKFFIFFGCTIVLAWVGFSQVFSQWASRAQADAEALALQAARTVVAQLPVSPYESLANSPTWRQVLANGGKASTLVEVSKRLSALVEEAPWREGDIALLVDNSGKDGKALWLVDKRWTEKAPGSYSRQAVEEAARQRMVVEESSGLKVFFPVEAPVGVDNGVHLWIGGPAVPFGEASLAQELKRTSALALGVVVSGKFVMQAGQPLSAPTLAFLNAAVANIQPGSAGMLKQKGGGEWISAFWGAVVSKEVAARQPLSTGRAELVIVLSNPATQEVLLGMQQTVFYIWLAVFLVGLILGFVAFPANAKGVSEEEEEEMEERAFVPPPRAVEPLKEATALKVEGPPIETSSPAAPKPPKFLHAEPPQVLSKPLPRLLQAEPLQMSPELSKLLQPEPTQAAPTQMAPRLPKLSPAEPTQMSPELLKLLKLEPPGVSAELKVVQAEQPRVLQEPSAGFVAPGTEEESMVVGLPGKAEQPGEVLEEALSAPPLDFMSMVDLQEEPLGLPGKAEQAEEVWGEEPLAVGLRGKVEQPEEVWGEAPLAVGLRGKVEQPKEVWGEAPLAVGLRGKAEQPEEVLGEVSFASPSDFVPITDTQIKLAAVGLRGKAVQPEEVLGEDHAPNENSAAMFEASLREEAERFLGADFLPEPLALSGERLSVSSVEGPEVTEWRSVYAEFLRVRRQCQQDTEGLDFERFKTKLEASKSNILSKHQCKTVRFLVQIKDGKAAIKAIPVRD
ncbi:MAG: hypothetical protein FWC28_05235 [Proteobacteria bacterium]|nr:hypothetical protein [Cystobacterineae bacterium]MCL2259170.1 hypothetical protein [Cystobacterineae bacterium]MCL2314642.1 hypothetical protein [Pseudomonadota bacterium]